MFQAKDRFPLIEAERRGICVKRALDSVDPDPYIFLEGSEDGQDPSLAPWQVSAGANRFFG